MPDWQPILRPAEAAEQRLIRAIIDGQFPVDTHLPAERELATLLGVTRPTLREALQRLSRDGWLEIRQGKPTRVCNFWQEGRLGVLAALADQLTTQPLTSQQAALIDNLLEVRALFAPAYTAKAVETSAPEAARLIAPYTDLSETSADYAAFDWKLHQQLAILSGNPVFILILNGFEQLYQPMARLYFDRPAGRAASRQFYAALLACAQTNDPVIARQVCETAMLRSRQLWAAIQSIVIQEE